MDEVILVELKNDEKTAVSGVDAALNQIEERV